MEPWSSPLAGRLDEHTIDSRLLKGNPLGDPNQRPLWVYVPPGYDSGAATRYPTLYVIQGLTGQIDMWRNRMSFRRNPIELADAMFSKREAPPCVLVYADCWTSLGGSQFVDSPATGRYHSYLCEEVVPFVDARYRTLASREHRGVAGKSSGGYGAMVTALLRPDLFSGLATHAGDALFEHSYWPDIRVAVRSLRDEYGGSYERFWKDFRSRIAWTKKSDNELLNVWCMAACYSADPDGTVQVPFDAGGLMRDDVWARWLAWDPVRMVAKRADAMRSMRAIYIDAGKRDEYFLDLGAEAFRRALADVGVSDPKKVFFELFDATHAAIEYRYPIGLKFLAERLG